MAQVPMTDAVALATASAAEYNKLIDNIQDLDTRVVAYEDTGLRLLQGIYPSQNTSIATGITTEANVVKLQVSSIPVITGHRYLLDYRVNVTQTVAGDLFGANMRLNTALSGTLLASKTVLTNTTAGGVAVDIPLYFTSAVTGVATLHLS